MRLTSITKRLGAIGLLALAVVGAQAQQTFTVTPNSNINATAGASAPNPSNVTETVANTMSGALSQVVSGMTGQVSKTSAGAIGPTTFGVRIRHDAFASTVYADLFPFANQFPPDSSTWTTATANPSAWLGTAGTLVNQVIPAGGNWSLEYFCTSANGTAPRGRYDSLQFTLNIESATPPSATDAGTFSAAGQAYSDNAPLGQSVRWYRFTTTQPTALNGFGMRMFTFSDTGTNTDSEMGLYSDTGTLIATNDDRGSFGTGGSFSSWLQWGFAAANQNTGNNANLPSLPAGTYYLAVARFNTDFAANWQVASNAQSPDPNMRVVIQSPLAGAAPGTFTDMGTFSTIGQSFSENATTTGSTVRWYRFTTTSATANFGNPPTQFGFRLWTSSDTSGNPNSTIAVYNATTGALVTANDQRGTFGSGGSDLSWLQWGATGLQNTSIQLPAGTYFVAVANAPMIFNANYEVTGFYTGADQDIRINALVPAPTPPSSFTDIGSFGSTNSVNTVPSLTAGEIRWYRLNLTQATAVGGYSFEIGTQQVTGQPTVDTEIGIYDNTGVLLASNDDTTAAGSFSTSPFSYIRWGGASNANVSGGTNPAVLNPGIYWIAVGRWNVTYAGGWGVSSTGVALATPFEVRFRGISPATTVTGTVSYPLWGPGLAGYPVTVDLRQGSTVVQSFNTTLDGSGGFSVAATAPAGNYDVYVRGPRLAWKVGAAPVTVGGAAQNAGSFAPRPGDIVQDNFIDGLDLAAMDASFNLVPGDPGYNPLADLNGDDVVDGLDLGILDANFNEQGDGDLP